MTTRRALGFTLLETLVMLIVSALAVMLMFQALAGFNRSRERISALEGVRNNETVTTGWIRDSFRGIVAITPGPGAAHRADDPETGLVGDRDGFTAMTVSPLLGATGAPVAIQWRVEHGPSSDRLLYQESGHEPMSLVLRDDARLAFGYLGADGKAEPQWPTRQGVESPLPQAIELTLSSAGATRTISQAIAITGPMKLDPYTNEDAQ